MCPQSTKSRVYGFRGWWAVKDSLVSGFQLQGAYVGQWGWVGRVRGEDVT